MGAGVGDRIRQHGNAAGAPDRVVTVIEVLGDDGPPYRVRHEDGSETVVTPGPDAVIEPGSWADKVSILGDGAAQRVNEKATEAYGAAREKSAEYYADAKERSAEAYEKTREKSTEAYEKTREKSTDAAGKAARAVSEAADKIAKRFSR